MGSSAEPLSKARTFEFDLVNTVADLANLGQSMFVEAANVRTSVGGTQKQLDSKKAPTDAAQIDQFESAQGQLSNALSRLLLIVERYPEWRASPYFLTLQAQLEGIENRIPIERDNFNTAVQSYNSMLPSGSKPKPKLQKPSASRTRLPGAGNWRATAS